MKDKFILEVNDQYVMYNGKCSAFEDKATPMNFMDARQLAYKILRKNPYAKLYRVDLETLDRKRFIMDNNYVRFTKINSYTPIEIRKRKEFYNEAKEVIKQYEGELLSKDVVYIVIKILEDAFIHRKNKKEN